MEFDRKALIEQLRADNEATREEVEARLAALEADPIAMSDFLAQESDDFIAKMESNALVFKDNAEALVTRHWVDNDEMVTSVGEVVFELRQEFQSGDKLLKQRLQALEQKVAELTGQLSVLVEQSRK